MSLLGPYPDLPDHQKGDLLTIVDRTRSDGEVVEHHALVTDVHTRTDGSVELRLLPDPTEPAPFEHGPTSPD